MIAKRRAHRAEQGQSLVLLALALLTIAIAVAVTIDGGNAFAQQRAVQNGSDAAALAGAVELGNLGSCSINGCTGPTSGQILTAINNGAATNGVTVVAAYYTDVCGVPLTPSGAKASSDLSNAAPVGGTIPPVKAGAPNCATGDLGGTAGVLVFGHRDSPTLVATVVGLNSFAIDTQATAVSTYGTCGASQGCGLLPIAFPVYQTSCDASSGNAYFKQPIAVYELNVIYKIPLCKNNSGNVGWIDWSPKAGGASEVADAISAPHNSPISFASWQFVYQPGNLQSNQVEAALRLREGDTVRAVNFDHTCAGADPNQNVTDPNLFYGCPFTSYDQNGNSANIWYHLHQMLGFVLCSPATCSGLHDAYMGNGAGDIECDTDGNGARACIVGQFVDPLNSGIGGGPDQAPVQLIK